MTSDLQLDKDLLGSCRQDHRERGETVRETEVGLDRGVCKKITAHNRSGRSARLTAPSSASPSRRESGHLVDFPSQLFVIIPLNWNVQTANLQTEIR